MNKSTVSLATASYIPVKRKTNSFTKSDMYVLMIRGRVQPPSLIRISNRGIMVKKMT